MIAAHPDDENTALLSYFARGRNVRTGYLSLTRGEGGQNLIGTEQGALLGLIRTQELLDARQIDGAQQFFSRAIDFGFSKTAEETLRIWGHDRILADVVWVIRRFQPDVIVLRFSGTPRDGHGHHQSSAILGKEAFTAAADAKRFPEQLAFVKPWQAKRIVWNAFAFTKEQEQEAASLPNRVTVDTGAYVPLLGQSFEEIAGISRSMHRSQGMGARQRKGSVLNHLVHVNGDPAVNDILDGIPKSWTDIPGGSEAGQRLAEILAAYDPTQPAKSIPNLLKLRPLLTALHTPLGERKLRELDEAIALCAGLWLDASAERPITVPGRNVPITISAVNRSDVPMQLLDVTLEGAAGAPESKDPASLPNNKPLTRQITWKAPANINPTQPYWLAQPSAGFVYKISDPTLVGVPDAIPVLTARFHLQLAGETLEFTRPVRHRYVDRVYGELTKPFVVAPPVVMRVADQALLFRGDETRTINVEVRSNSTGVAGSVRLATPKGWHVEPSSAAFNLPRQDEAATLTFRVTPASTESTGKLQAIATLPSGEVTSAMIVVEHPHIPPQTVFPEASVRVVKSDVKVLAHRVGYIMGAGDLVSDALKQLGVEVTLLDSEALAQTGLSAYDAIVAGVRAFNTRDDLRANRERLLRYVENGGTFIVQYNVAERGFTAGDNSAIAQIGPYPMTLGQERVSVEDAPVRVLKPQDPLLQKPNVITAKDFEGWVQERGLYFATKWDPRYEALFSSNDPGEPPRDGGTLVARYGKGTFIYTGYAWFRQLPAGVPGAYRIFANFLSASKLGQ